MAKAKKTKSKSKSSTKAKGKGAAKPKPKPKAAKAKAKPKAKAKAAPKPKAPKAPKAPKITPSEQIDELRSYGGKAPSPAERAHSLAESEEVPRFAEVKKVVLDLYRDCYPIDPPETDEKILATDPNDYDMDPGPFYETLQERFGVANDENNDYFGGYGGKVESTIAFLTKHWDGKLRETSQEMFGDD